MKASVSKRLTGTVYPYANVIALQRITNLDRVLTFLLNRFHFQEALGISSWGKTEHYDQTVKHCRDKLYSIDEAHAICKVWVMQLKLSQVTFFC